MESQADQNIFFKNSLKDLCKMSLSKLVFPQYQYQLSIEIKLSIINNNEEKNEQINVKNNILVVLKCIYILPFRIKFV